MSPIPYGRQNIVKEDVDAVAEALNSDWLTQGPAVKKFEDALAAYCGARYAVAVSSGTAALHVACLAAGFKKGDEAITTPITFVATPNSVIYAGAKPVLADIDYRTMNIDPENIRKKLTKKTRGILPVHYSGLPCDMPEISSIARKKGLVVIEDACHALGARYEHDGEWIKIGSCRHSDMTVFSFHPVKHITTGEGGAITTNSDELYKKLLALRTHGIYKDQSIMKKHGSWYYEMRDLGFNYRITDFQCALGASQLGRVDDFIAKRRNIAAAYDRAFSGIDVLEVPFSSSRARHVYHLYALRFDLKKIGITRQMLVDRLKEKGIFPQVHYIPVYRQPYYKKKFGLKNSDFPAAEKFYARELSMPMYPSMNDADVECVISVLKECINSEPVRLGRTVQSKGLI